MRSIEPLKNTNELDIGDIVLGIPKSDLLCKFGYPYHVRRAGVDALLFEEGKIILYDLDNGNFFYWEMDIEPSDTDDWWTCFVCH